ncbi:hypothetical protein [Corynebacterium pacaense]|uniref:hypothetical protein n=1 Tax=Corynebacterium pacaense TaxID=1816684 RepID=UPI0009BBF601|nr:hypothetical protein [Corynebacterium pacaense]
MNIVETSHWVDGLFPGRAEFHEVGPFTVAAFDLGGESVACSVDFGRVDTGLITSAAAESLEVRSELLCLARAAGDVPGRAVGAAATMLLDASTAFRSATREGAAASARMHAQPGQLLPAVGIVAGLPAQGFTVSHGILADPRIWGPEIPFVREEAGQVSTSAPDEASELGRLTLPLQLILLTEEEFGIAAEQGGDVLMRQMAAAEVDLLDLRR